jgi:hypothetical protein
MEELSIEEMAGLRGGKTVHIHSHAIRDHALSNSFNTSDHSIGGIRAGGDVTIILAAPTALAGTASARTSTESSCAEGLD